MFSFFNFFVLFQMVTLRQNVWLFLTQKPDKKYSILNIYKYFIDINHLFCDKTYSYDFKPIQISLLAPKNKYCSSILLFI